MKTKTEELFDAIKKPNLVLVNQLIAEGVDVNAADEEEFPPIHLAIIYDRYEIIEALIKEYGIMSPQKSS